MMRYVLSSLEYDPRMPIDLTVLPSTERGETSRRVNRVATLDGDVKFNDFGSTDGDRTIRLIFAPESAAQEANVIRMVQTYTRITVSGPDGLFLAAPQSYVPSAGTGTLTLLVERKLST
jgi:hypothetical protein